MSFERGITEKEPEYLCKKCNHKMSRHFSPFGIQFKGSGFYKTDNPK
jgi:predicted nucleic acid-binding Zn ribbon protein